MGHHIQVILAPRSTAEAFSCRWPDMPRLNCEDGFAIFPVDADWVDERVRRTDGPVLEVDGFQLLSHGFRQLLGELSQGGMLAYLETEYFGGVGGQGALVFRDGIEIMPPTWGGIGTINNALRMLGVKRGLLCDEFATAGLDRFRDNDGLMELIAVQR